MAKSLNTPSENFEIPNPGIHEETEETDETKIFKKCIVLPTAYEGDEKYERPINVGINGQSFTFKPDQEISLPLSHIKLLENTGIESEIRMAPDPFKTVQSVQIANPSFRVSVDPLTGEFILKRTIRRFIVQRLE